MTKTTTYTVQEIDRLRSAVYDFINPWIRSSPHSGYRVAGADIDEKVELQLRTYMLNGTRPEEVEKLVSEREKATEERITNLEKAYVR